MSNLLLKAARCVVVARADGSFHVADGDHPTHIVQFVDGAAFCNCTAGRYGRTCAHKIAVANRYPQKAESA